MRLRPVHALSPVLAGLLSMAGCAPAERAVESPVPGAERLVPLPVQVHPASGEFRATGAAARVAAPVGADRAVAQLLTLARALHGIELEPAKDAQASAAGIRLVLDAQRKAAGEEGYVLDIAADGILLAARTEAGLFHGATTLAQLLRPSPDGGVRAAAQRIEDAPRFGWRGLMLDSARHFQSVEEIKHLLDAMALHKLNVFHWHLTDDQGWRIQIRKYPRLTEVGGCRIPAGEAGRDPVSGEPRPYCGHYTQDQIRQIVAYAAERHITVVPEIDMPGHAQAAVAAYPELGAAQGETPVSNEWGVHTYLFNVEESTLSFLEDVLAEVIELFPSEFIHIGGDEAVKDQWQASPRVQQRMRELGIGSEEELQSWFVRRMERFLAGHGRRLIGWDEILEGGLPPNATVMSWRGTEGGLEAASHGHDVVMSPVSHLYMDYLQTDSPNEPPGRPATIPLQQVYAFEPVPEALAADRHHHILGLQANVWTEHMRNYARVQHAVFPRIAALAETGWTPRERKDYDGFLARLPDQLARYEALGIAYAQTPFEVDIALDGSHDGPTVRVALSTRLGLGTIRYTLDGSEPTPGSPRYDAPLSLSPPLALSARAFVGEQALAATTRRRIDADSLRRRSNAELAMCTGNLMLRLEDDGPAEGQRAIFNVDIFNPCWEWRGAPLDGTSAARVRAGRIPYYFQLWRDEAHRSFRPADSAHGELEIRSGCDGELLASHPLPAEPDADGFLDLTVPLQAAGSHDLCLRFTGDTRPAMWVLDEVRLLP